MTKTKTLSSLDLANTTGGVRPGGDGGPAGGSMGPMFGGPQFRFTGWKLNWGNPLKPTESKLYTLPSDKPSSLSGQIVQVPGGQGHSRGD